MRAIFLDCETGGLESATDALCSIGCVVFDTDAATVDECILARAHWPICVPLDSRLKTNEEALRVQGMARDALADSGRLTEKQALEYLAGWSMDSIGRFGVDAQPWSWNAAFDSGFLKAASERHGGAANRFVLCAQQFAWAAQALGLVAGPSGRRLTHWAQHYGLAQPEPHNAQADAEVAAKVLWHLVRVLKGEAPTPAATPALPTRPNKPGTNTGHGHVWERPDGAKARCGGPAICRQCAADRVASVLKGGA
jgi:DNA polymerase III epsilon subunit-like protein